MAVGVGMGTVAGVTIGRMLARGVDLLPVEGLGLLLGDGVLGVGRMLAVGGSDMLELMRNSEVIIIVVFVSSQCKLWDKKKNNNIKCIKYQNVSWKTVIHMWCLCMGACVSISYLPLSWDELFKDICLCSVDLG